jgi:PAS domain S-box-containing protein
MPQKNLNTLHFSVQQFEILLNLYKSSYSSFEAIDKLHEQICTSVATGLDVARVSIWEFEEDSLRCLKLYDFSRNQFIEQEKLNKKDFPNYFESLQKGIAIVAPEAQSCFPTNDLTTIYLQPLKIFSMLDLPLRENGKLVGILCCECLNNKRDWTEIDISFARSVADILTLITEEYKRKLVEQSLFENQDRFKFISENISDGIYIIENKKLVFASKTYLEMIGLDEVQKHNSHNTDMFELLHPEDKEIVKSTIYGAAQNKLPFVKYKFRCLKSNGDYMWREDIMNIHYDISGFAFRAVTIARDITEEKNLELKLEEQQKIKGLQNGLLLDFYANYSDSSFEEKLVKITEIAVKGLIINKVSYWELENDNLICKMAFDGDSVTHSNGQVLYSNVLPKYIEAIKNKTAIIANNVYANEDTKELVESYFKPLRIQGLLDVPIRLNGLFHGVLCCEHSNSDREWSENDISFARALADHMSVIVEQEKRKLVEEELKENQEKLDFIAKNTSDGIIIIENRKISYVSPSFEKLSGYSKEFIKGLSLSEMFDPIHPDDAPGMKQFINNNLDNKVENFKYEYRFLKKGEQYYWREDSISVVYDENSNEFTKYVIVIRDIHERKVAELKIRENEQQLKLIFENSTDGFVVIENNKVKYISQSYCDFLGFDENEMINFPSNKIYDLLHPDDQERIKAIVNSNILNQSRSFTCELRIKGLDGKYHWREDLANIIYNPDGTYSKYIVNSRDIKQRKLMEEKLVESEKQLRIITENTSDGVAIVENSIITYMSPSYLKLVGFENVDYSKVDIKIVFETIHPEDREATKFKIYDSLAKQLKEFKYEHRIMGGDGQYHWREDSANIIYDINGKYEKYIVVTRDIADRKEVEKEKSILYKLTEKQNEKLTNFTHIVSHDIRSHTSNLSMILDLYEESESKEEELEYFNMLKQSTNKLSDTIFYLNETVAIQSGVKNTKVNLNLGQEIEKTLMGINAIVKTNQAQISIHVPRDIFVFATQSYLESIIFNLLTNALKYRSPIRKPIITIKATKEKDEVKLTISDNGIGIDLEKNKDKIFGMYKTFNGNSDALGLGLFMVKNHIESMGGRIEIDSKLDIGTTFNLYFI